MFIAHHRSFRGRVDSVKSHLLGVAALARKYATAFNAPEEAHLAGLLHDLGKYGNLFQERLRNPELIHGIDHWSAGAWHALTEYKEKGIAIALAVQGHHVGLQLASKDFLSNLNPTMLERQHPLNLRLSEPDLKTLLGRMQEDGLQPPLANDLPPSLLEWNSEFHASAMLDIRMLFSTLVDADFIETEAHFNAIDKQRKTYRPEGPPLEPSKALKVLLAHLKTLAYENKSRSSEDVSRLRNNLLKACLEAGRLPQGLFTLTAPTGSGKTLSMLAFALKHAEQHDLRRVVVVIPYLSIIEQTVNVYRGVFSEKDFGKDYILEHHSLAGTHEDQKRGADYDDNIQKLLAQNWDAPIVVTTSVQFFESLFANRSSACRKLHRLSKSVILFDEAQTFPVPLAVPTLAALSRLTERYGSTVVFSTATQPAFTHLHDSVKKFCACGWNPKEIVPPSLNLFRLAKRTRINWPDLEYRTSWEELAESLTTHKQVLCVVNLKRHALSLFSKLKEHGCNENELFHLSTNMCPEHRKNILREVRNRLNDKKPCRLISTQCIEAGVDVDFPVVYRAWGPLDSIAQAAGRCNRNGNMKTGTVYLFVPPKTEGQIYPDGGYEQAASVARILLKKLGRDGIDIHNPQLFLEYYRELYDLTRPQNQKQELIEAIRRRDFVETAELYRIIAKDAINVLVPYNIGIFQELGEQAREEGLSRQWIKKARPHTIGLFRPKRNDPVFDWLEPIKTNNQTSEEWFIYLNKEHYNLKTGLVPPESVECLIG